MPVVRDAQSAQDTRLFVRLSQCLRRVILVKRGEGSVIRMVKEAQKSIIRHM